MLQSNTINKTPNNPSPTQSYSETPAVATDDLSASPADVREQLRRLQADFANFRRRGADIADRAAHDRAVQIVTSLLPSLTISNARSRQKPPMQPTRKGSG